MRQIVLIEMGMGVDLQGQDATKASVRAVRDAVGRIYLPGLRAFMTGEREAGCDPRPAGRARRRRQAGGGCGARRPAAR